MFNIVCAQQAEDDHPDLEISVQGLLTKTYNIDAKFSNLPYSGVTGGVGAGLRYGKKKISHQIGFCYTSGNMQPASVSDMDLYSQYVHANYTFLHTIYKGATDRFRLRGGATLDWLGAKRKYNGFINSNSSSETISSLGAAGELSYRFEKILGGIGLSDRFNFPVFSYIVKPWILSADQKDHREKRFTGPGSCLRMENAMEIRKSVSLHHAFSICYSVGYYHIEGLYPIKNMASSLNLFYTYIF